MTDIKAADLPEWILNILRSRLYNLMSDISEEHWCAAWLIGNEFELWRAVQQYPEPFLYGMASYPIDMESVAELKRLSEYLGQWATFDGVIGLEEWRRILADRS